MFDIPLQTDVESSFSILSLIGLLTLDLDFFEISIFKYMLHLDVKWFCALRFLPIFNDGFYCSFVVQIRVPFSKLKCSPHVDFERILHFQNT